MIIIIATTTTIIIVTIIFDYDALLVINNWLFYAAVTKLSRFVPSCNTKYNIRGAKKEN